LRSKSQVMPILPSNNRKIEERLNEHTSAIVLNANSANNNSNSNMNNNHNNVTIWREELNAKNNVQQQIRKQVNIPLFLIFLSVIWFIDFLLLKRPNYHKRSKTQRRTFLNGKKIYLSKKNSRKTFWTLNKT
jgi:hypothetical protein